MNRPYNLFLEPEAHKRSRQLPGHVRQRVKRLIDALAQNPRPDDSQPLDTTGLNVPPSVELRRIRLAQWRLIYAINETEGWVWVWGLRQRPPYDYEDLTEMVAGL